MSDRLTSPCAFCRIVAAELPASTIYEDDEILAMMDIQPVNPGHVLVLPKRHFPSLQELPEAVGARLFMVARRAGLAIQRSGVRCEGIGLTLADGAAAGQEVPHLHMHVIPRFAGDSYRVGADRSTSPSRAELDAIARAVRLGDERARSL